LRPPAIGTRLSEHFPGPDPPGFTTGVVDAVFVPDLFVGCFIGGTGSDSTPALLPLPEAGTHTAPAGYRPVCTRGSGDIKVVVINFIDGILDVAISVS
jgi:hypothetical protein